MRFSLITLLLISIWCGAALGVWFRREAWVFQRFEILEAPTTVTEGRELIKIPRTDEKLIAPDQIRYLRVLNPFDLSKFWIGDVHSHQAIYEHVCGDEVSWPSSNEFKSNDIIILKGFDSSGSFGLAHYRRRFPEWWWGHFYRPEVWAFGIMTLALFYRAVRTWRKRRALFSNTR